VAQFSTSFTHGGRPKAGAELIRNKLTGAKALAIMAAGGRAR